MSLLKQMRYLKDFDKLNIDNDECTHLVERSKIWLIYELLILLFYIAEATNRGAL